MHATVSKHLDLIHATIDRLARNSFALKGWSAGLATAVVALLASQDALHDARWTALPLGLLAVLDAYYLGVERQFRRLHSIVAASETSDLSMDPHPHLSLPCAWSQAFFSPSIVAFHIPIIACVLLLTCRVGS